MKSRDDTESKLRREIETLQMRVALLSEENAKLRERLPLLDIYGVIGAGHEKVITVPHRIQALGYEPDAALSTSVGNAARQLWQDCHGGSLPAKALSTKVSGRGSQCHAIYPRSWTERIDAMIHAHAAERQSDRDRAQQNPKQLPLFKRGSNREGIER